MKRVISAVIGVVLGVLVAVSTVALVHTLQKSQMVQREHSIKLMMSDIFAPKTMEQFDKSRKEYEGRLISESVANQLYRKYADELTEEDLKRSVEVSVYDSEINSFNKDCYIADLWLYNSGVLEKHIRYKLMFNGKLIDGYILEILG